MGRENGVWVIPDPLPRRHRPTLQNTSLPFFEYLKGSSANKKRPCKLGGKQGLLRIHVRETILIASGSPQSPRKWNSLFRNPPPLSSIFSEQEILFRHRLMASHARLFFFLDSLFLIIHFKKLWFIIAILK